MSSLLVIPVIAVAAVVLAIGLAYLPMRLLLMAMAKAVAEPIRDFIQRQRDRRAMSRATPDRRNEP